MCGGGAAENVPRSMSSPPTFLGAVVPVVSSLLSLPHAAATMARTRSGTKSNLLRRVVRTGSEPPCPERGALVWGVSYAGVQLLQAYREDEGGEGEDDRGTDRDAVEVALDHRGPGRRAPDAAAEHVREAPTS